MIRSSDAKPVKERYHVGFRAHCQFETLVAEQRSSTQQQNFESAVITTLVQHFSQYTFLSLGTLRVIEVQVSSIKLIILTVQ